MDMIIEHKNIVLWGKTMECKNCKYYKVDSFMFDNKEWTSRACEIAHIVNPKACAYIENDKEVEDMTICFNCKYWIGGGDWGLSCQKDYYNCSTNGFNEVCEQFERK